MSHLVHHRDERLTDPLDDPESHYWTPEQWAEVGFVRRRIIRANATLLGRVTIGPAWSMGRYLAREAVGADPRRQGSAGASGPSTPCSSRSSSRGSSSSAT